jgi:MinD-like ATPase involved in chromosome partitioning or flagellar assembly
VADMNLIIITPDITAIADGYGLFKYLLKSKKNISVALLVNRAEDGTDYEYIYQKFAVMTDRFLGKIPQAAGYLLDDKAIAESVRRQKSVFELSSASGSAEQFLNLCDFLTETGLEISVSTPFKREQSINSRAFLADIRE